jgi:hypothetical protein
MRNLIKEPTGTPQLGKMPETKPFADLLSPIKYSEETPFEP